MWYQYKEQIVDLSQIHLVRKAGIARHNQYLIEFVLFPHGNVVVVFAFITEDQRERTFCEITELLTKQ